MSSPVSAAPVEAVLFDYGLVLTGPPHPPAWERMKALLGATEKDFHASYWGPRHDYDRGQLNGDAYWKLVVAGVGAKHDPERLRALIEQDNELWTQPNQPMIDWAAALQASGMRTGILSNLGDAMEAGVRVRCPWLGGFDHLTFSHHLRTAKPDFAIYRHAAEGLGVDPARVLFIDDRADNIAAARQTGMQAVQYTTQQAFEQAMRDAGLGYLLAPATKV